MPLSFRKPVRPCFWYSGSLSFFQRWNCSQDRSLCWTSHWRRQREEERSGTWEKTNPPRGDGDACSFELTGFLHWAQKLFLQFGQVTLSSPSKMKPNVHWGRETRGWVKTRRTRKWTDLSNGPHPVHCNHKSHTRAHCHCSAKCLFPRAYSHAQMDNKAARPHRRARAHVRDSTTGTWGPSSACAPSASCDRGHTRPAPGSPSAAPSTTIITQTHIYIYIM